MNEKSITAIVSSDENVARLISSEWMQEGILQPVAFTLDENESYLSVNRPVVETYDTDVASYFEIMNNRGEQLQKHEILKSFILGGAFESDFNFFIL